LIKLKKEEIVLPKSYQVIFKIHYKVNFGDVISVIGNIPELGNWNNAEKQILNWSDGDIWISKPILIN
jgi:hypothetical protein